jgi:pimeloyl-ACP methyl ester carboxylesterase
MGGVRRNELWLWLRRVSLGVVVSIGLTLALALPATAPAQTTTTTVQQRGFVPAPVTWKRCPDARDSQCARLTVPMDTVHPGRETVSLALLRAPATKPKQRLGVLLVNPGGPGGSGRDFAAQIADSSLVTKIRERYDIVGWDPRGVGRSTPIRCLDNAAYERFYKADPTPDDAAETAELVAVSKLFVAGCVARNGSILQHVSTVDTVQDMEWIRQSLGVEKVSFLGFSYGTYLGAIYADRFPTRVDRFVLDGVLDPSIGGFDRLRLQATGFERALTDFLQTCGRSQCTFVSKGETPAVAFDRLMASIERTPLAVRTSTGRGRAKKVNTRLLGAGESQTGVLAALYNVESGWPRLRTALNAAARGEGAMLLGLFDLYADRTSAGSYGNVTDANAAVNCTDLPSDRTFASYETLAKEMAWTAPHFGAFAAYSSLLCAYWPTQGPAPVQVHAPGAPPILLIGTTRDPATPYPWAVSVQKQLAKSRLLTYDADGHTAFLTGNTCVRRSVEAYLLRGTLPAVGTICDS